MKGSSDAVHDLGVSFPALFDVGCWNHNTEGYKIGIVSRRVITDELERIWKGAVMARRA